MRHTTPNPIVPLRNLPISMSVDGAEIGGTILWLYPNDIEVEWNGQRNGLHVPYFSMFPEYRLAITDNCVVSG